MMKKITQLLIVFPFSLLLNAQSNANRNEKVFSLSGKVFNASDGTVYLLKSTVHGLEIDSTILKNNQFHFSGKIDGPCFAELSLFQRSNPKYTAAFFIEPGKMEIVAARDDFRNLKLVGSASQKDYERLVKLKKESQSRHDSLWNLLDTLDKEIEKGEQIDDVQRKQRVDSLQNEKRKLYHNIFLNEKMMSKWDSLFIVQNPSSYVTAYLIFVNLKVERIQLFPLDSFYNKMPDPVRNSGYGKRILLEMNDAKIAPIGKKAPLFKTKDLHGSPINLADFRNNDYVLLDFWGSWCGPCRMLNPTIKSFYQNYGDKGLKIISIAINDKDKNWRKAIEDDQIDLWAHILDDSNSAIRNKYAANFVPLYFLIDRNGIVLGKYSGGGKSYGKKAFYELVLELKRIFEKNDKP